MKQKQFNHTVIFDLDGTLINTAPDVRLALNNTLKTFGQKEIGTTEIYELIGNGASIMIQKAFAKKGYILTKNENLEALSCYLNFYKNNPVVETNIYPGVLDVLYQLKQAKVAMGICTNKPGVMTRLVLQKLGLYTLFDAIVPGDEIAKAKPHRDHIYEVLNRINKKNSMITMVGDSIIDYHCATNANISFIGVSYGYDAFDIPQECLIDHFSDLPLVLEKMKEKK